MNIKSRINARKLVLTYLYEKLFIEEFSEKQNLLEEIFRVERDVNFVKTEKEEKQQTKELLKNYYIIENWEDDIEYLAEFLFKKEKDEWIDFDYVKSIISNFSKHKEIVEKTVNEFTSTFKYFEMDIIDRILFIIWYTELVEVKTDRKIVLNEMIELAKRYWDAGSFKLVNGILHKLIPENSL